MHTITTIGLDIAKSVFQVHGVDAADQVVIRRQLKRRYVLAFFQKLSPCLVGIEACASSHHWSRELQALGHTVRLMPPAYVKPYVKRQKNDATDAEAICEAVSRANMRFVATKTVEQQSCLVLHRTRHLFIRQQTSVINAIRAHLAEFGIVAPVGRNGVEALLAIVADPSDKRLPEVARACLAALGIQLRALKAQILEFDRRIDRLCITCCLPFPTFTSRRVSARSRLRRQCYGFLVSLTSGHHRPGHPRDLVGERDGGDLCWSARQECREPGPMRGAVDLGISDDGKRARCEQAAQIAIALLADAAEPVLAPTRMLLRHQPDPGREVPP